jgi:hypothetical protein
MVRSRSSIVKCQTECYEIAAVDHSRDVKRSWSLVKTLLEPRVEAAVAENLRIDVGGR